MCVLRSVKFDMDLVNCNEVEEEEEEGTHLFARYCVCIGNKQFFLVSANRASQSSGKSLSVWLYICICQLN